MDDNKDIENNSENLGPTEGQEFSPSADDHGDDFPDNMPAVSITKRKNALIFIVGFGVAMFVVYSLLNSAHKKAPTVQSENQKMQQKNLTPSAVPGGNDGDTQSSNKAVSASSALPGAQDASLAVPTAVNNSSQQATLQETLPPPPTLPPVFDPASVYLDNGNSGNGSAPSISQSGFGSTYTTKRDRLPEIGNDAGSSSSPSLPDDSALDPEQQQKADEDRQHRAQASMFVGGSGSGKSPNNAAAQKGFVLDETSAGQTKVTVRKNLQDVILQGKVIDAVLETAINTDLPGKLRAILSHDVYSEDGKRVVIPKGSRLIGSYATDIKFGQARVYVVWSRVIRPDGIDAVLDGNDGMIAVDSLGRSGVYGQLDNRFFEIFGSSILLSTITVAFAVAADAAAGGNSTETTTTSGYGAGTTTSSNDIASQGVSDAVLKLGNDMSNLAQDYINTKPRITVDQGTRIKIFVNKDIIFPPSFFSQSGVGKSGVQFIN